MSISENKIQEVFKSLSEQKEKILLDQLEELVSRGLICVEETQPVLVETIAGPRKYVLKQAVRFILKDQEYIEELEEENRVLRKNNKEACDQRHYYMDKYADLNAKFGKNN